jgi:Ca2+-binding EF-hand superfamily protein
MNSFLRFLTITPAAVALIVMSGCMSTADANTHRIAGGATPIFHKLDTNNDGKVTYREFDAGFADLVFDTYDRNGDGIVTRAEWNSVEAANQDQTKASFAALDRNHDGKLTRAELNHHSARRNAVVKQLFARIDKNGDGVITEDEARAFGIRRASDRDPANHP